MQRKRFGRVWRIRGHRTLATPCTALSILSNWTAKIYGESDRGAQAALPGCSAALIRTS